MIQKLSCNQKNTDSERHIPLARVFREISFFIQYYLKGLEKGNDEELKLIIKNEATIKIARTLL